MIGATGAQAIEMLEFYLHRWTIKEYFKTLKSGVRIEDRKLDRADDFRKCFAFDVVTEWRVFDIDRTARDTPELLAIKDLLNQELETLDMKLEFPEFPSVSGKY